MSCRGAAPALTLDYTKRGISDLLKRDGASDPAVRDYWIHGKSDDGRETWRIERGDTDTVYSSAGVRISQNSVPDRRCGSSGPKREA